MPNLPKVVRDRLAGAPAAATSHPDPDLVAAFVEGAISGRERDGVLTHLAACAACREVVSLAAPEFVADRALVAAAPGPRSFWSVPMLRWAGVAATVVVVFAVGLMFRPSSSRNALHVTSEKAALTTGEGSGATQAPEKTQVPASLPPSTEQAKQAKALAVIKPAEPADRDRLQARQDIKASAGTAPAAPAENPIMMADNTVSVARSESGVHAKTTAAPPPQPAPAEALAGGIVAGRTAEGAMVASRAQAAKAATPNANALDLESAQVQTSAETVETTSAQLKAGNEKERKDELQLAKKAGNAPSQAAGAGAGVGPGRAGGVAGGAFAARPAAELMATPTSIAQPKLPARWTIDAGGNLQRSYDLGKTWEPVPVADGVHLQALAVWENEIWAGGTGGALYHSSDRGGHWARVQPKVSDLVLSDDVNRIRLTDPQHVTVMTSTAQVWVSADGGQTWRKNSH